MRKGDNTVGIFARCSRLLTKLSFEIKDEFFSSLLFAQSDRVLEEFIIFLKLKGEAAEGRFHIVRRQNDLLSQIEDSLKLIDIVKYLNMSESSTPLLLERELLFLKRTILDFYLLKSNYLERADRQTKKIVKQATSLSVDLDSLPQAVKALSSLHQRVFNLIKSRGRIQNIEIFETISGVTRRTLKRKLSELLKLGLIARDIEGKKVSYFSS